MTNLHAKQRRHKIEWIMLEHVRYGNILSKTHLSALRWMVTDTLLYKYKNVPENGQLKTKEKKIKPAL